MKKGIRNQRFWMLVLMASCMGAVLLGGISYVTKLRNDLTYQAIRNVLTVTEQQKQAFDTFLSGDRERLHSYAEYFARNDSEDFEGIQQKLMAFYEVDAFYSVINLETGQFCASKTGEVYSMADDELETYRALSGSGVRDHYTGLYMDETMFGYYEHFTFADGAAGLIQKSYNRSKVSETFSLSFYNDQGFAYVVNRKGDILLRSAGLEGDIEFNNIFDILTENNGEPENIDSFGAALDARETGSIIFTGSRGSYVYTYVPVENMENWFLVSIVPLAAITEETDHILLSSQQAVGILLAVLIISVLILFFIWHTGKDIEKKDREIEYQEQLFDIFSTYLSNNTDDVYMMVDVESGQAEYVSPNVERVLGIPPSDVVQALISLGGDSFAAGEAVKLENMASAEPNGSVDATSGEFVNPQTGEHRWFHQNAYCTLVQGRRKLVVYISDRTQERAVQDTLREALEIAKVASNAKSAFLSSVSHDIRTPMNAIVGFTALLREEAGNPDVVREYAQRIDAAGQHLLGLINDVLDMNKIESGSATLNLSEMSLAGVIDEINTIIRPQAKAKNQTFELFVSHISSEHLLGDKLRINQILINLLSNAVKYTPEGGCVQMRVEEMARVLADYSRIRFTISDNGLGMSEEYQKVIFDPFTREETQATRQIQGTGLGMAITKSLVDLMGGTIQVQSVPGEGSVFTVELELRIQKKKENPQFWKDYGVSRMMIADDEEEICQNIVRAMAGTGVVTDYATSGEKAIEKMREAREAGKPYDLILLDWKMPQLDGLATARLIRQNYPDKIPIVLFTAYEWGEIEQEASEIGIRHFMPKPFFMSTFQNAIRRVMGEAKGAKEDENGQAVSGRHILVVDDIEVNRIILIKILGSLGARCDVAGNGQEAVEKFTGSEAGDYDLILMDVQMPVMDGYAATRAIRASGHPDAGTIPIIAMTANAFVDDIREAISSGMDAHVAKPVQLDTLKATIRKVLDKREHPEESTENTEETEKVRSLQS